MQVSDIIGILWTKKCVWIMNNEDLESYRPERINTFVTLPFCVIFNQIIQDLFATTEAAESNLKTDPPGFQTNPAKTKPLLCVNLATIWAFGLFWNWN